MSEFLVFVIKKFYSNHGISSSNWKTISLPIKAQFFKTKETVLPSITGVYACKWMAMFAGRLDPSAVAWVEMLSSDQVPCNCHCRKTNI